MRILVLGSGGREHALVWKLHQSPRVRELFAAPGNPGTEAEGAVSVPITVKDEASLAELVRFAKESSIDFVVPGPELPLTLGVTDALRAAGIPCFGPDRFCAQLEGSKAYAKALMQKTGVPTAGYRVVTTLESARSALTDFKFPLVVKADGLAAGKGVVIVHDRAEAESLLADMLGGKRFGDAGKTVVLEEFLTGEEVSLLCFCDGTHIAPLPSAQDHKAAFDGDTGPNTGGMGAYSPCPLLPAEMGERVAERTVRPIVQALAAEGHPYVGVLYAGLMMTKDGPKVLEYNVRFGDPECQPLLMRLDCDLLEIMEACVQGRLDPGQLRFSPNPALGVVLAAEGYPGSYAKGQVLTGLSDLRKAEDLVVFQSGTKKTAEGLTVAGGRILCVTAKAATLQAAQARAYEAIGRITCPSTFYRHDIGTKGLRGSRDVLVLLGSASDEPKVRPCLDVLRALGISFAMTVTSAHRTPERTEAILRESEVRGTKVFICAAGMAAHLAGAVAARTWKPVIGIPISGSALLGMDALFSTVQMPSGFPVATVALDSTGAKNAAWLAAAILALNDSSLAKKIEDARQTMRDEIVARADAISVESSGPVAG